MSSLDDFSLKKIIANGRHATNLEENQKKQTMTDLQGW